MLPMVKRSLLVVLVSALVAAPAAHAQAACTTTSLQAYIDLGSTGCTVGTTLFKNFVLQSQADPGATISPASAAAITVTPTLVNESPTATRAGFSYTGSFGATLPANTFGSLDIFFAYLSLDAGWTVRTFTASRGVWTETGVGMQYDILDGPDLAHLGGGGALISTTITDNVQPTGVGGVGFRRAFGNSGAVSVSLTELDANVRLTPTVTATPEPASLALTGTGLLGFAGLAYRRRVRR